MLESAELGQVSPDRRGQPVRRETSLNWPDGDAEVSGRGVVTTTFLFTDLEGSTELWERAPARMAQALATKALLLSISSNLRTQVKSH